MTASKSRTDAPTDLLPCPHCQGTAEIYYPFHMLGRPDQAATYRGGVRCRECGCQTKATTPPEAAIAVWNLRAPVQQTAAAPCTCSGLGPCEKHTDGSCRLQRNSTSAPVDERAAYSLSATEPGFEAAWPSIHRVGFNHGWRGVALAAWRSAYAYVRAATMRAEEPRAPSGYAYRYPDMGRTVIRFNNGEEVNGSRPIEAVPYWFDAAPDVNVTTDKIAALIARHSLELERNDYAYFELAYTRRTEWMAWICSNCRDDDPDRKVIARGQGATPEEACASALDEASERGAA